MKSKNSLAKTKQPAWILADHEIPGLSGLRSMHIDPTKITLEEANSDIRARKSLEIAATMQILYELSDVNQAAQHADRWNEKRYSQRRKEDGRSPFLRFSAIEKLISGIDATYSRYIESIGIGGLFRYSTEIFNADVIYDFSNRQPTKVVASVLIGQDTKKAERAISKLPHLIMPKGKFHLSSISIRQIERLGDYEERKRAIEAAVLTGYIKYGGRGKPMYSAWIDLIERAANSERFIPENFYLRVNDSFSHHNIPA